jgi:hypothetical protein
MFQRKATAAAAGAAAGAAAAAAVNAAAGGTPLPTDALSASAAALSLLDAPSLDAGSGASPAQTPPPPLPPAPFSAPFAAQPVAHPGAHGIALSTTAPRGEFDRPAGVLGAAPPLWEWGWVAADATLASTLASTAAAVNAAGAAAAAAASPGAPGGAAAAAAAAVAAAAAAAAAADRWPNERGLNVLAIRLADLKVVYDTTFDTYGFKRRAGADCAALAAAAAPDGELGLEGPLRWRWRDHLIAVTSAGTGWEATPDAEVSGAAAALMRALGAPASLVDAVARASVISPLNKNGGRALAVLGLCGRAPPGEAPSGAAAATPSLPEEVTAQHPDAVAAAAAAAGGAAWPGTSAYASVSGTLKDPAVVRLALACDGAGWFPTFSQVAGGRWAPAWSAWGGEPWGLAPGAPASELRRVERYLLLLEEVAPLLGGPSRASLTPLLACLAAFAATHMAQRQWPVLRLSAGGAAAAASAAAPGAAAAAAEAASAAGAAADAAADAATRSAAAAAESALLTRRGDDLVRAFEKLLERLLAEPRGKAAIAAAVEGGDGPLEAAAEAAEAGVFEYLCARVNALVAAAAGAPPPPMPPPRGGGATNAERHIAAGGVLRVRTERPAETAGAASSQSSPPPAPAPAPDASVRAAAAASEGRRVVRLLCRCLNAGHGALLAEGVRRGALAPLLSAFSAWWPHAPYTPGDPAAWAAPQAGDIEDTLYRLAALDIGTIALRVAPASLDEHTATDASSSAPAATAAERAAAAALPPVRVSAILTGLTLTGPRGGLLLPRDAGVRFRGHAHVIEYVPPKKGAPLSLLPPVVTLPPALREAAGGEGGGSEAETEGSGGVMPGVAVGATKGREGSAAPPRRGAAAAATPAAGAASASSSSSPPGAAAAAAAAASPAASARPLQGAVVFIRARPGDAAAHASLVTHAPRLVHLAAAGGAVAVAFVWPRVRAAAAVRPLLPNPNCDAPTGVPSFVVPSDAALEAALDAAARYRAAWRVDGAPGGHAPWGAAAQIGAAIGAKLAALAAGEPLPAPPAAAASAAAAAASPPSPRGEEGAAAAAAATSAAALRGFSSPPPAWLRSADLSSGAGSAGSSPGRAKSRGWQSAANPRLGEEAEESGNANSHGAPGSPLALPPRNCASEASPARGELPLPAPLRAGVLAAWAAASGAAAAATGAADDSASEATPPSASQRRRAARSALLPPTPDAEFDTPGGLSLLQSGFPSSAYWADALGAAALGAGSGALGMGMGTLDFSVSEAARVECWDATEGVEAAGLAAGALASALAQALADALALAEGGDVAAAASAAAAAAAAVFGADAPWPLALSPQQAAALSAGGTPGGGTPRSGGGTPVHALAGVRSRAAGLISAAPSDPSDPVREAAARFLATLAPGGGAAAAAAAAAAASSANAASSLPSIANAAPSSPGRGGAESTPDDPVRAAAARILCALGSPSPAPAPPPPPGRPPRPVRILALDGGGVRGLVELAVLRRIAAAAAAASAAAQGPAEAGAAPPAPLHLCDLFDIIVGTSTGGVIAAGAALGMPLDELESVYRETASVIFKPESYSSLLRSK